MISRLLSDRIQAALGVSAVHLSPLTGGMIGDVSLVELADGQKIVAKTADSAAAKLSIEGYMLTYLAEHSQLPVPQVLHSEDTLLLMTWIEGSSHLGTSEQQHAAELLAALHSIRQPQFGLERDTLIGPLHQPNPLTEHWIDFFRQHRLLYMAQVAHRDGPLPASLLQRIEKLSERLEDWLTEPEHPSLIHGDIWTTNVLTHSGRVTGFIDPAIYYAHAEIELAYTSLFGTFGRTFGSPFLARYHELRPIAPGFFEERRDLYNLYPLLVHVRLFGGSYASAIEEIVRKFGF